MDRDKELWLLVIWLRSLIENLDSQISVLRAAALPGSGGGGGGSVPPFSALPPPEIAATSSMGGASSLARGDHTHGHGDQAGGTLHAVATTLAAGFLSGSDKGKLDGIASGATFTPLAAAAPPDIAATAAGRASTRAWHGDHAHGHADQARGTLQAVATTTAAAC